MTTFLLTVGAFILGYVAGAVRIAKRLNPLISAIEPYEPFVPCCDETSVQTLKRASETLQTHAASMRGVAK